MKRQKTYKVKDKIGEADSPGTIVFQGDLMQDLFILPNYDGEPGTGTFLIPAKRDGEKYFIQIGYVWQYDSDKEEEIRKETGPEELISFKNGLEIVNKHWVEKKVPMGMQNNRSMAYIDGVSGLIMVDSYGSLEKITYNSRQEKNMNGSYGTTSLYLGYDEKKHEWLFVEVKEVSYENFEEVKKHSFTDGLKLAVEVEFNRCF